MLRNTRPRPGLSLVEVLIAMFVMAIGMIAIFTLFPLGAIKIGQALKDDRTSQTATQADAYMRAYWRSEVVAKLGSTPGTTGVTEEFFGAMQNGSAVASTPYGDSLTPSYPVLIDPMGWFARSSGDQRAVASTASGGTLQRRNLSATTSATASRVATMSDDLTFEPNGAPSATEALARQGRYTWAALVQRTESSPRGQAELTILVYDGRARLPAITGSNGAYNDELAVRPEANEVAGSRQMTVKLKNRGADDPVLVREGGWVLVTGNLTPPLQKAEFYRVVALTESPASATETQYALDLEKPLTGALTTTTSQLYFFAGLSEVFPRLPLGTSSDY